MKWFMRLLILATITILFLRLLGYELVVGSLVLNADGLETLRQKGPGRSRVVIGGCVISNDIDATALAQLIPRLVVIGGLVAPRLVADAYGGRLKAIGGVAFRESS